MKRPLLFILIFLLIGIFLYFYFNKFAFVLAAILLFLILFLAKFYKSKIFYIYFIFTILGIFLAQYNTNLSKFQKQLLNSENVIAYGVITDIKNTKNGDLTLNIKIKNINIDNKNFKKTFNVSTYLKNDKNIKEGYFIRIEGKFINPKLPSNPNAYNEYLNLKSNDIDFKLYTKNYTISKNKDKFLFFISNLKTNLANIYDNILPTKESAILKAIILGDKQDIDKDLKQTYINAGVYHILAISGLHLSILGIFLCKALSKINKNFANIITIFLLIFYCIFTGASLSTIRATIMICIMIISNIFYKEYDLISSASLSAIILIIINPFYIFNIGFLYSYFSVFAIGLLAIPIINTYNLKGIKASFVLSFFVSLAIKPISAYFFYRINTIDFLLNLIIIPFASFIILVGFLVLIIGIFSLNLATIIVSSLYYIFRFFTFIAKIVENIDFANIPIAKPSILFIISFYIMLTFIAFAFYDKRKIYKNFKFIRFGLIIFLSSLIIQVFTPTHLQITMLDVEQGECIIGEKGKDTFLIDCGSTFNHNIGEKVIIPYLNSKGIKEIDFVFITHMDTDHINGLFQIIPYIDIKNIFIPNVTYNNNKNYSKLYNLSKKYNINLFKVKKGDSLILDNNIKFNILSPNKNMNCIKENNNSLVFELEYLNNKILFTGDIENLIEKSIIQYLSDVDILKVAHHGSKTSSLPLFLEKANPEVSLISCGKNNLYKHPHSQTIQNLSNTKIFRTDEDGAIILNLFKNNYTIKTVR